MLPQKGTQSCTRFLSHNGYSNQLNCPPSQKKVLGQTSRLLPQKGTQTCRVMLYCIRPERCCLSLAEWMSGLLRQHRPRMPSVCRSTVTSRPTKRWKRKGERLALEDSVLNGRFRFCAISSITVPAPPCLVAFQACPHLGLLASVTCRRSWTMKTFATLCCIPGLSPSGASCQRYLAAAAGLARTSAKLCASRACHRSTVFVVRISYYNISCSCSAGFALQHKYSNRTL